MNHTSLYFAFTYWFPYLIAMLSGFSPSVVWVATEAFFFSKRLATLIWPRLAARCKGVICNHSNQYHARTKSETAFVILSLHNIFWCDNTCLDFLLWFWPDVSETIFLFNWTGDYEKDKSNKHEYCYTIRKVGRLYVSNENKCFKSVLVIVTITVTGHILGIWVHYVLDKRENHCHICSTIFLEIEAFFHV